MTEAGWTREPDFTEVAHKLVLKINEIQQDQWDQYDDKDQSRIMSALKATYRKGRVAGELFGLQQGLLIAHIFENGSAEQVIEGIKSRIAELAQAAQGEKVVE